MAHMTVTLKLFRPSRAKQALLQDASRRYAEAFRWLLVQAESRLEEFHAFSLRGDASCSSRFLRTWVDKEMSREMNRFGIEPFKDSLKNDFAAWMASYLVRWEQDDSTKFTLPDRRALLFCRYDTKRDWCLAYNPETDRFFAKLYLVNRDGSMKNGSTGTTRLIHVHRDRTPLCDSMRMLRYVLVPLAFGKRQEAVLKNAIQHPERFRCARLLQRNGEWYLACSLEMEEIPQVPMENRIGFARAMHMAFSYTVSSTDGRVLTNGLEPLPPHALRPDGEWTVNGLHHVANRMTALSREHAAQAVIAPLIRKGDHLHWADAQQVLHGPKIDGKAWNRILNLLRYKLPMHGLPPPVAVSPNNMFRSCPVCGRTSIRNRMGRDHFLCVDCGHTQRLDTLGSRNLALRLYEYEQNRKTLLTAT